MCPGNQVVASPAQTLFTANLPGTQSSALWTMVCVLRYPSHNQFGQFESHDPGSHDLGAPIRGWPTISQWPRAKIRSSYDQILSLKNLNSNTWEEISSMLSKVKQDVARQRSQGAVMSTEPEVPRKDTRPRHASGPDSTNRFLLRNLSTHHQPPQL